MKKFGGTYITGDGVTPFLIVTKPPKTVEIGTSRRVKVTLLGGKPPTKYGIMRYVALVTPPKKDGKTKGIADPGGEVKAAIGADAIEYDWTWETAYEGEAIFVDGQSFADCLWWKLQIPSNIGTLTPRTQRALVAKLEDYDVIRIDRCEVL